MHKKDWIQKELSMKANASLVERLQSIVKAYSDKYDDLLELYRGLEARMVNGNNKRPASPVVVNPAYKRNNIGSRVMEQVKVVTDNISMFMCVSSVAPWFTHYSHLFSYKTALLPRPRHRSDSV